MRASTLWSHRVLRATVTSVAAVALIAVGVSAAATTGSNGVRGPGYPPPKGIYAPFTNCPLNNPFMHENTSTPDSSTQATACIDGHAVSGSITIGKITTPVTEAVDVQFGFVNPPNHPLFPEPVVPPLAGTSAILSTKPDLIPGSLTSILGCPSSNATVQNICQKIPSTPGGNQVYALAQEVTNITNFNLFSWTQAVKFNLINPLLGSTCYIGTDYDPIVLNPQLSVGPGGGLTVSTDPNPTAHPDTEVLTVNGAVASDTTFAAPEVTGCGPGGNANVPVDEALDAGAGLPAASGTNSLTLNGTFGLAVNGAGEDASLPQPQDQASALLAAFKSSTNGGNSVKHQITMAQAKAMFHAH